MSQQHPTQQPWGWTQPPTPPPARPTIERKPGWWRRNLATVLAGTALSLSLVGLFTPAVDLNAAGPQGPQGVQGEAGPPGPVGPAGPAGKNGKAAQAAPAPAPAPEAPAPAEAPSGAEFGEGTYKVGTDIQPGEYKGTVTGGLGYWARLDSAQEIIDNDVKESGSMYFRVLPTDKYVEISGATFHKV